MSTPTVSSSNGTSYLYMAAAFVVVVAGMKAAEAILNPLLLAVFLAIISAPAYFGLVKRGFSEWLSMLMVITGLTVIVLGVLYFVVGSIASFTARQDHYQSLITERKRDIQAAVRPWIPEWAQPQKKVPEPDPDINPDNGASIADPLQTPVAIQSETRSEVGDDERSHFVNGVAAGERAAEDELRPAPIPLDTDIAVTDEQPPPARPQTWGERVYSQFDPGTVIGLFARLASSIGQLLGNTFLILLTVVFLLLEVGSFSKKMTLAFVRTDETARRAADIINSIQHYLAIKTMMSLLTGVLIFVWLMIFRVPYAGLWGLLAFLLNYVPNVGSIIAAIPAVLIAWLELSTMPAVATLIGYVLVNTVVGNFLEPRLMGRGLGLSVLVVFCSMVFWGWVLGPIGMLLSVPLTMTARIALDGFEDTRWMATLMGNVDTAGAFVKQSRKVS